MPEQSGEKRTASEKIIRTIGWGRECAVEQEISDRVRGRKINLK